MSNIWNVARFTLRDLIRSKVMWNIPVLGGLLSLIVFVSTEFTYGVPWRVATNMGLSALTLSVYGIVFFAGVTLIRAEAESRTIYLIISRPISRRSFLIGKLAGVSLFLALNTLLLFSIVALVLVLAKGIFGVTTIVAVFFLLLEALLLLLTIVVISMVSNVPLTFMFSAVLLVAGHAVAVSQDILWLKNFPLVKVALQYYHWVLPGFHILNFKDYAIYALDLSWSTVGWAFLYWLCYLSALLLIGCKVIDDKDFD